MFHDLAWSPAPQVFLGNGSAVLSAFYPRLYGTGGLTGSVWAEGNATAKFGFAWSQVASASFTTDE